MSITDGGDVSDVVNRLHRDKQALCVASTEPPSYVLLSLEARPGGEFLVEALFSPECVDLGGVDTDVVVVWGTQTETHQWVQDFVRDFFVELCPAVQQPGLIDKIFLQSGERLRKPNADHPWILGGLQ